MRRCSKLIAVLLSLAMCLSLLPAGAFAEDELTWSGENKNRPGYDIKDHTPYDPAEFEGVLDEQGPADKDPKNDDSSGAATDVIMDKLDQEAVEDTKQAAEDLEETTGAASEAVDTANKIADALGGFTDTVNHIPEYGAEAAVKDETVTDKTGEVVKVLDVQLKDKDDGTQVPTVEVKVEVKTDENGKPETREQAIDDFAAEKSDAVEKAKTDAEGAATNAASALTAAQAAVESRDQAALDTAKNEAADACAKANEAARSAAENYAVAEKVVTDAQAAYDAAVASLKEAGYSLENIEEQLKDAQDAVTKAQNALENAAGLKAEAEKQRDYALLYNSLAQTIIGEYDETTEDEAAFLADVLAKVRDLSSFKFEDDILEKINTISEKGSKGEELTEEEQKIVQNFYSAYYRTMIGGGTIIGAGQAADNTREAYLYWLNSPNGKAVMAEYAKKKADVEKWEKETKEIDVYCPFEDWAADGTPLGSADLIYKMYYLAIQDGVAGKGWIENLPGNYQNQVKQVRDGLEQYLKAEEFLEKIRDGESATLKIGYQTITYNKDEYLEELKMYEQMGISISMESALEYYTASIQLQVQTEMAKQLGSTYERLFLNCGEDRQTLYNRLQSVDQVTTHEEFHTFMKYMDLLQYELQFRQHDLAYGGAWDVYKGIVSSSNMADTMVDSYFMEIYQLRDELARNYDRKPSGNADLDAFMYGDMSNETVAKGLLTLRDIMGTALADPGTKGEASVYETILAHMDLKKEEAKKAADAAIQAYDIAVEAAKAAKAKLNELLNSANLQAIKDAEAKLADAQTALSEAEANRDDAIAAQQAAEADYTAAMALTIAIIDGGGNGGGSGSGSSSGGSGSGSSGITINDEAVPLAAGPVTRAQFLDYLWRHEGSPEGGTPGFPDVPAGHEFAQAIGWAQASGLVFGYGDGTFRPDELVNVQAVRTILGRFANVFGAQAVAAAELTTLTGEDDAAVLNCDEVLAEFFGEEYISARDKDEAAA